MTLPFIGPSYSLATRKADVQRTVNMFPVMNEVVGGKTAAYLQQVPGLDLFSQVAAQNTLSVVKTQANASALIGGAQTYTIVATNNGPGIADGGLVTDVLPAAFTFTSCTIAYAGGATGPATATAAALAAGIVVTAWPVSGTATLTIIGTFNAVGLIVNTATTTVAEGRVGTGDSSSVTTSVHYDIILLLHMEGTEGSSTFTDDSLYHRTAVVAGAQTITNAQAAAGVRSFRPYIGADGAEHMKFSSADFARVSGVAGQDGDWTMELFFYYVSSSNFVSSPPFWEWRDSSGATLSSAHNYSTTPRLQTDTADVVYAAGAWHHLALSINGTVENTYLDGALIGTRTRVLGASGVATLWIGTFSGSGGNNTEVYIDEVRVIRGVGLYPAAGFTAPTIPFPNP